MQNLTEHFSSRQIRRNGKLGRALVKTGRNRRRFAGIAPKILEIGKVGQNRHNFTELAPNWSKSPESLQIVAPKLVCFGRSWPDSLQNGRIRSTSVEIARQFRPKLAPNTLAQDSGSTATDHLAPCVQRGVAPPHLHSTRRSTLRPPRRLPGRVGEALRALGARACRADADLGAALAPEARAVATAELRAPPPAQRGTLPLGPSVGRTVGRSQATRPDPAGWYPLCICFFSGIRRLIVCFSPASDDSSST